VHINPTSVNKILETELSQKLVIRGGTLIDGTGKMPEEDVTILVEGDTISTIGKNSTIPAGAQIIEASGKTVMPGLMDMHVHLGSLFFPLPPGEDSQRLAMLKTPPTLKMLYGAKFAKDTLEAGFTTLRNLDTADYVSLRKGIERGLVPGPRLIVSGLVNQTGGHYDLVYPSTWPRSPMETADGIWEVRKLTRHLIYRLGADLIKTMASGGTMGEGEQPWWRNYTVEELKAIVDEAHAIGKKVAAHCSAPVGIKNSVEVGIDTIEHTGHVDRMDPSEFERLLEEMKRKNTILVPTLAVGWANVQSTRGEGVPEYMIEKAKASLPHATKSFRMLHEAGVKMAMGTDTVGHMPWLQHGDNAVELELMVKYGMTPMEAIVAATRNGAECAGIQDITGTLETGKKADIIVVDGDPLKDIKILKEKEKIHIVIKEGQISVNRQTK
jgi:imidazolonepropionase-like amidohydrolase